VLACSGLGNPIATSLRHVRDLHGPLLFYPVTPALSPAGRRSRVQLGLQFIDLDK
jgi:hypothetical protein